MSHRRRDVPGGLGLSLGLRVGGPLLGGGGGGIPKIFSWDTESGQSVPGGSIYTRTESAFYFSGTQYVGVAVDVIRDAHRATDGGPPGYLAEPAATNRELYSTDFENNWFPTNLPTVDDAISPLGLNQSTFTVNTSAAQHRTWQNTNGTIAGTTYNIMKAGVGGRYITIRTDGPVSTDYACFDLVGGVITEIGSLLPAARMDLLSDGWHRSEIVETVAEPGFYQTMSNLGTPGTAFPVYAGADETYLCCHAQREATPFSTTPIITAGAQASRGADVFDTGVVIPEDFSVLLELTLPNTVGVGETISLIGADTSVVDIIRLDEDFDVIMDDGGTPVVIGTATPNARISIAYARDPAGRSASFDGAAVVNGGAPGSAHEGENFHLGCTASLNQSRSIHHLTNIYPERISDPQLPGL